MNLTDSQETFLKVMKSYILDMYALRQVPTKAGASRYMGLDNRQYFQKRLTRICKKLGYDVWEKEIKELTNDQK